MMKKIFGLLALLLLFSCDDGEMNVQSFDFGTAQARQCPEDPGTLYRANGNELLILDLDESNFPNVATPVGQPRIINFSGATVRYRQYSDAIGNGAAFVCSPGAPATPTVTQEWISNGGTIQIQTFANYDENTPTLITGYRHEITLVYVSLTRDGETIIMQNNYFGEINTALEYTFNFNASGLSPRYCDEADSDMFYIISQNEALIMPMDAATYFPNQATAENSPRIRQITGEDPIYLNIYESAGVTGALVCGGDLPEPDLESVWKATTGTLEITTTHDVDAYIHTIKLRNVTFVNTANLNEAFTRDNYTLTSYIVTE